jgi:c-di-GMP-related signal transduction protein
MATTLVMGRDKSSDLVLASMVRARFCELIAPKVKNVDSDLFLMGMLSLMDAILEVPIGVVIEKLSLDPNTKAQLLAGKTHVETPLSPIYDLMIAREAGDWQKVTGLGKKLDLSLYFMNSAYNEAMRWAHQMTSAARPNSAQHQNNSRQRRLPNSGLHSRGSARFWPSLASVWFCLLTTIVRWR